MMLRSVGAVLTLAAALAFPSSAPAAPPSRIVSLNVCTDQLLVDLVPPGRIAALSYLASDPSLSAAADAARRLPSIRGTAEEALALDPDLVLAGEYSTPAAVDLLRRLGRRVVVVPMASTFEEIRKAVRVIAEAVGERERGDRVIAEFDRRLAAARPNGGPRPTALAYQINSLAAGPGTLLDAAIEAAGFANAAAHVSLGPAGRLPLEALVASPPDLIVLSGAAEQFRTVSADNLRHPAFAAILARRPHVTLGMPLWLCGTPRIAEAVERLAAVRATMEEKRATGR